MKVIRFPGAAADAVAPKAKKSPHRLLLGATAFTCPTCGTVSEFSAQGMVFRTVEFYCNCCGSFYKVTNPAFATQRAPR